MRAKVMRLLTVLTLMSVMPACAMPITYSAESIEAWVVDAETKKPIEGAVVVAHWVLEGGIHVDRVGDLVVVEMVTNKDGRFYFPAWGPIRHWNRSRLTNMDPEILIFKGGYKNRRLANPSTKESIEGKPYPVRRSFWNGKTIELKRLKGTATEQFKELFNFSKNVESFTVRHPEPCNWLQVPQTLRMMMRERVRLEGAGVTPTWDRTVDKQLLDGEKYFVSACGQSPMTVLQELKEK